MHVRVKLAVGVATLGIAGVGAVAIAHDRWDFGTRMTGYEEVPAISTEGNGTFKAAINRAKDEIRYVLTYAGPFNAGPDGTVTVTQAHIHFGQPAVTGGISVWLCGTTNFQPPSGPKPPDCPPSAGTVTGTITAANVIGPAGQGIAAGEFDELVRALRAGVTYANVHTTTHLGGEIRGQISAGDDENED